VHNCDILSDIALARLIGFHLSSGRLATLCVSVGGTRGNISFRGELLLGIEKGAEATYTGISVYNPRFLSFVPAGFSHLPEAWLNALGYGEEIGVFEVGQEDWVDVGTKEAYMRAVFSTLRQDGENLFVHPEAETEAISFKGFVSIEQGSVIGQGTFLEDCIVLGARLKGERRKGEIIGESFCLSAKGDRSLEVQASGSERRFSRVEGEGMLMEGGEAEDFDRFVEYTRFFRGLGLPVPEVFSFDRLRRKAIIEDLGDVSLYNWLKLERRRERVLAMYERVLDKLVLLHTAITDKVSECPLLKRRIFDKAYFRWETEYFMEWYVGRERGLALREGALASELDELASICDGFPKVIIHRDLQSRNIMVKDGTPFFIDYQGARIGPPGYDLASLLFDPYFRLEESVRYHLMEYYIEKRKEARGFDDLLFRSSLPFLRLQRHMQALGAYAFLSLSKKKRFFRKYMAEALLWLKEDIREIPGRFPALEALVHGL
jgi:aminoglycoside/choline kinase family phosphotransferase